MGKATYLDCDCPNGRDDVERSTQNAVVRQVWIVFPYRRVVLNSGDFGDVAHYVHIGEVYHMLQTTVEIVKGRARRENLNTYGSWFSSALQSSYAR